MELKSNDLLRGLTFEDMLQKVLPRVLLQFYAQKEANSTASASTPPSTSTVGHLRFKRDMEKVGSNHSGEVVKANSSHPSLRHLFTKDSDHIYEVCRWNFVGVIIKICRQLARRCSSGRSTIAAPSATTRPSRSILRR